MAIQTAIDSINNSSGSPFGFKNRIINGAMVIDQRNAGASVTPTSGQYLVDRFQVVLTQASKFTAQQGSASNPVGFTKALLITSSSAYSVAAGDLFTVGQQIEGFNAADFAWGTANAQTITMSFWARSSLTGTHAGNVQNYLQTQSYVFTYTISAANTWEYKTITIPGATAGTWATDNTSFAYVRFNLGVGTTYQTATTNAWIDGNFWGATGAVSVVGTNGATFYITGVQLEKGSVATSFDYRPYGTELQLCQRYYEEIWCMWATVWSAGMNNFPNGTYKVNKRAVPTTVVYADATPLAKTGATGSVYNQTNSANITGANVNNEGTSNFNIDYNTGSASARNMRASVTSSAEL
jgi:hypothetical protein